MKRLQLSDRNLLKPSKLMKNINRLEWLTIAFVFLMIGIGLFLSRTDEKVYRIFVAEDGIVEWFTVIGLLIIMVISFKRVLQLKAVRSRRFIVMTALLGAFFFLGAGEEVSWGQRIFNVETPEFFRQNNAQMETNLHNMVVGGVSINKLIFSKFWLLAMLTYWFIMAPLYKYNRTFGDFVDSFAVPVPRFHHVVASVVAIIMTEVVTGAGADEITELAFAFLFMLQVAFPYNKKIFDPDSELTRQA